MKNGELTVSTLQSHNQSGYKYIKERIIYFDKIYEILTEGELVKFYPERAYPYTHFIADFIIYKNGKKHIYHLFLRRTIEDKNLFAPVSFIVRSHDEKHAQQYIERQEYKNIKRINIKEIL